MAKKKKPILPEVETTETPKMEEVIVVENTKEEESLLDTEGIELTEEEKVEILDKYFDLDEMELFHLFDMNPEMKHLPLFLLEGYNPLNGVFYNIELPFVKYDIMGRLVQGLVKLEDVVKVEYKLNSTSLISESIPFTYDIVKEGNVEYALFNAKGKLNFKDLFDFNLRTLKFSL